MKRILGGYSEAATKSKLISLFAVHYVKFLAAKELLVPISNIEILHNEFGKPYIAAHPEWQFNISHADGMLAIAISNTGVGVDVERIRNADLKIARRFFTEQENKYIEVAKCDIEKRFFEIWTKKEAYVKWIGKGLNMSLNSFDVLNEPEIYMTYYIKQFVLSICQQKFERILVETNVSLDGIIESMNKTKL